VFRGLSVNPTQPSEKYKIFTRHLSPGIGAKRDDLTVSVTVSVFCARTRGKKRLLDGAVSEAEI
jgi:hypothetical protein